MALLTRAQRFNAAVHVTGLLILAKHDKFVQTIEGTVSAVSTVYERIVQDNSHKNIDVFVDESIQNRVYPDWAMLGDRDNAAPTLVTFLRYALLRQPSPFTAGQIKALSKTLEYIPPN